MAIKYSWQGVKSAYEAWCESSAPFQSVEGCQMCVTWLADMARGRLTYREKGLTDHEQRVADHLDIANDPLIPSGIPGLDWEPSDEVLERFDKLQDMAKAVVS